MAVDLIEDGETDALAKLSYRMLAPDALAKIETVADLRDALFLLLTGHNVTAEPIEGVLSAWVRPLKLNIVRRDENGDVSVRTNGACLAKVLDTPLSMANAIAAILSHKSMSLSEWLDVTIKDDDRFQLFMTAIDGIQGLLNRRAMRLLTVCDIADLMEWLAPLSASRLDSIIAYGHASWGWFAKRQTDTPELDDHRPAGSPQCSRTIVFHVRPDRDDLDALLVQASTSDHPIGVVNGATMRERLRGARGLSPDKAAILPSYGIGRRVDLDLTGLDPEDQWKACRLVARMMMRERKAYPKSLQAAWQQQDDFRRTFGLSISGVNMSQDYRNHATYAAIKMADALKVAQPSLVTCDPAPATVTIDPMDVPSHTDELLASWDDLTGRNYARK